MKIAKLKLLVALLIAGISLPAFSQVKDEEVLMTISGKKITVGEFMAIYQKNNPKGGAIDRKNLDEYLELFVNFKLKVREAEDLGLDTLAAFKNELKGYRDQLAKPYFTDEATIDRLVREAYDRMQSDIRASHIFVRMRPDAAPADTVAAYDKMLQIRERILKGESFEKLAAEQSEDPSARDRVPKPGKPPVKGNYGDLGYFTVFDMVYPFESAAYSLPVGGVSMPVRTEYGYHLIKVTGRQPALGKVTVAHLFMLVTQDSVGTNSARVKLRIDSVYLKLKTGANWDELVKQYSDDRGSAAKGGNLPEFGVNRMVPEFITVIYNLKQKGDFSQPVETSYGWHIIRLVDRKIPGTFDEEKATLRQRVTKDARSQLAKETVLANIKNDYGFTEYPDARKEFYTVVTDSVFSARWDQGLAKELTKPLFKIGNMTFFQPDFAQYIAQKQKRAEKQSIPSYVDKVYKDFVDESLIKWENAHLEKKYPDFRNLMGEYRDGILLFDLTDQKVWTKAVKDTTGLREFYEKNRSNYMWDTRVDASVYTLTNPKLSAKLRNFLKDGLGPESILKEINTDSVKVLSVETAKFSRKENKYVDAVEWTPGISGDLKADTGVVIVGIKAVLKPEPKSLGEARGLITADYQNYLEKLWIQDLRKRYPVVVYREVLSRIK